MPVMTSELRLNLRDGVTGPAKIVNEAMNKLSRTMASAFGVKGAGGFAQGAASLRREAAEMQKSMASMQHSAHGLGTALAGLGIGHEFGEFLKAGADYRRELIALKNSGKTQNEIAQSMRAASEVATALPTQTFADSIKIINETTAAYGDLGHALENLKFNSKFESNMKSVLGEHADPHMLQNMVRALEIRGTAFDPKKYQEEAGKLGKAFAFTRGAVNPENFYDFAKNSNPDIKGFSTQFLTEVVPSLIQTFSAPGAGTGIKALEKVWRGGLTDKSQAKEWVRVGMVSAQAVQDNKGQSPGWKSGMAAYSQLARENPLEAMTKLLEKLKAVGVDIFDPNKLGPELDKLFKNSKARAMAYELGQAVTRGALMKDARLIRNSQDMDQQYENNKEDPAKALQALKAGVEDLMASMSGPLMGTIAHTLWDVALGVQHLASVLNDHPMLGGAAGLALSLGTATAGVAILRSSLSMLGLTGIRPFAAMSKALIAIRIAAMTSAAWVGRSFLSLLNPLWLVRTSILGIGMVMRGIAAATGIGLLVAAGALIYQNWSNIGVAFEAFKGAFMRALGPMRPVLQPILNDIQHLWEIVSGLIQPTGDMGDEWAKAGIKLGKLLGKDVAPWAQSIRNVYEAVKSLGTHWSEVVAIITSDDPIGRAVTALSPAFNKMMVDLGNSIRNFDWAGAWDALRAQADPVLTKFFTGWVQYAEQGATALMSYDWIGLGARIVQAIIQGIENMGGALSSKLWSLVPFHGSGSDSGGRGGGGGAGTDFGDATHVSPNGSRGGIDNNANATPENADAIKKAAKELGTTPEDLATVIGYETAGSFDPGKVGGAGNNYQGLIQFGPEERRKYGVTGRETFPEQMEKVKAYLRDRGFKPGMGLMDLYSTINAGSPGHYGVSDGNGTVRTHVARMQAETAGAARAFLAKSGEPVAAPAIPLPAPPPQATASAPSPAGTSAKAISDAEAFAARQRALLGAPPVVKISGPRARGGSVGAGRAYLVGEHGPEVYRPLGSGNISPHNTLIDALKGGSSGGRSGDVHFKPTLHININGGDHMHPGDIGNAVVDQLHGELLTALESTFTDKG